MRILIVTVLAFASCANPASDSDAVPAASPRPDNHGGAATPAPGSALSFRAQDSWEEETPSSSMRVAQYRVPGAGDAEDASLVVYHFKSSAGNLDANIQRWASQFEQPDGSDSMDALERNERSVAGMRVHEVFLSGTFVAEVSPGSEERVLEPGWRMLAAIIESDHGQYYVKLVGPEPTVRANDLGYQRFLDDVRVGP